MCGILGAVQLQLDEASCHAALDTLASRGPDGQGVKTGHVADYHWFLGHRRLSILDLSSAAAQPMQSPRTGTVLTYNGEIYNFSEVRELLLAKGYTFTSSGDTEVLLAAWDEWGAECLARLNGMFAFATWNPATGRLFLARDRLGIKPLYYHVSSRGIAFGSSLAAVRQLMPEPAKLDETALQSLYAYGYFAGQGTLIKGIQKVPAGSSANWTTGEDVLQLNTWWQPMQHVGTVAPPINDVLDGLSEQIQRSVQRRLISDVPLGVFLSGGIDSSLVAAYASEAAEATRTFSIGFQDSELDEATHAAAIAAHLGTSHETFYVSPNACLEAIPSVLEMLDEPFSDSSIIPTWVLCRMAREHVTVALSGDGGDELHFGYEHHRRAAAWHQIARTPRPFRALAAPMLRALPGTRFRRLGERIGAGSYGEYYGRMLADTGAGLLSDLEGTEAYQTYLELDRSLGAGRDALPSVGDLHFYLPDDILWKTDRASMANSLEVRVPLLDHELVEYALSLSPATRGCFGEGKVLLKQLLGRKIPDALWRRPKQGFAIPLNEWFRGELQEWLHDELRDADSWSHGFISTQATARILDAHMRRKANCKRILWGLVTLRAWLRRMQL